MRTLLTDDLAQTVASSIIASRLYYCNAMLYSASAKTFDVMQWAQNNLARVVCRRGGRTDARPLVRSLHWLPVKHRVTYKMASLMFKTMSYVTPAYLSNLIQMAVPVCPLLLSDAPLLTVPRRRSERARRAFSVAALPPATHYHLTLDPDVLWTLSNDTSRPTCSDSLNLMPPAPLYLQTLRRYTNLISLLLLFIIIAVFPPIEAGSHIQPGGQTSFVVIEAGSLIQARSLTEAGGSKRQIS